MVLVDGKWVSPLRSTTKPPGSKPPILEQRKLKEGRLLGMPRRKPASLPSNPVERWPLTCETSIRSGQVRVGGFKANKAAVRRRRRSLEMGYPPLPFLNKGLINPWSTLWDLPVSFWFPFKQSIAPYLCLVFGTPAHGYVNASSSDRRHHRPAFLHVVQVQCPCFFFLAGDACRFVFATSVIWEAYVSKPGDPKYGVCPFGRR